ncbi:MAG: hypothetical protein E7542_00560 [Ruminococcaceae bacterium]|nr:hypothetical protein [Oscillospiraceae bacterium]
MSVVGKFLSFFPLKKLLKDKRFTVPFSILLAFILWLIIVINENPIIERSIADLPVTVNLSGTIADENGMNLVDDLSSEKFTVIVRGPTYLVSSLKGSDFNVYASAAAVDAPGEYKLDVVATANSSNSGYEILKVSPSTVDVSFDYIETTTKTVEAQAPKVTTKQKGLIVDKAVLSGVEKDTVDIKGPRSIVNQISKVVAITNTEKSIKDTETFDANIILYDENGKEIPQKNLQISLTEVKVTVAVAKKKIVPVHVSFENLPVGFDTESISYTIDHKTVTVIGKPDMVDKTDKVTLSPIDVSLITKSASSFDVSAKLPDGVRIYDNVEKFTVKFKIANYRQKTFDVGNFKFTNLGNGLSASGSEIKNVNVLGPYAAISKLKTKNLYALVDLSDKKEGQHTVKVLICFKNEDRVWAIGSYDTTITIK